jgi:hypothetical protein
MPRLDIRALPATYECSDGICPPMARGLRILRKLDESEPWDCERELRFLAS